MSFNYHEKNFKQISDKLVKDPTEYEYMGMFKNNFQQYSKIFDKKIKYIQIDNILVNETVHSQYIYNVDNPTKLIDKIDDKIEELEKVIRDLKNGKEEIINDCINYGSDIAIKRDLRLDRMLG